MTNIYLEKIASIALVRNAIKGMGNVSAAVKGEIRRAGTVSTNIATKAKGLEFQSKGTMGILKDNRANLAAGKTSLSTAKTNVKALTGGTKSQQWDARDRIYRK